MMVSGDKKAWRGVEGIVRAAAPASFYGGRRVEWANTIGVGVVAFLVSVRMVCFLPYSFRSSPANSRMNTSECHLSKII